MRYGQGEARAVEEHGTYGLINGRGLGGNTRCKSTTPALSDGAGGVIGGDGGGLVFGSSGFPWDHS